MKSHSTGAVKSQWFSLHMDASSRGHTCLHDNWLLSLVPKVKLLFESELEKISKPAYCYSKGECSDHLTSLAIWLANRGSKRHSKIKSDCLGPCSFKCWIPSRKGGSTTGQPVSMLYHPFLEDFFPLFPASISSGSAHECFLFTFFCAPIRGAGLHLLHSSPFHSGGQQLDSPHPSPVHHTLQQYDNVIAKWEAARCWEWWTRKSGWTTPTWGNNRGNC